MMYCEQCGKSTTGEITYCAICWGFRDELAEQRHVENRRIDALHDLSVGLEQKKVEIQELKSVVDRLRSGLDLKDKRIRELEFSIREYGKVCSGHYTYADPGKELVRLLELAGEDNNE